MKTLSDRYDRNIRLFGDEGQRHLLATHVVIVGVGGLGSALVQPLALLGVGHITLIEHDPLDKTSRNRFIGARESDPDGSLKVELAARYIVEINTGIKVTIIRGRLETEEAFDAIRSADWVFGCLDHDGPRAILNELCAAYSRPYIDLATDVPEAGKYGGHVCISIDGGGCLECMGLLDADAVRDYLTSAEDLTKQAAIYGIDRAVLSETGPSVSPLNGVVANLAALEFMAAVTGMRAPTRLMQYRAHDSIITKSKDAPRAGCPICKGVYGKGDNTDVYRFLRILHFKAA